MRRASVPPYAGPLLGEPLPVELLNTVYVAEQENRDGLRSPADLAAWLHAVAPRLTTQISARELAGIDDDDLSVARDLRGCITQLVDVRRGGQRPSRVAIERLNRHARSAPWWPELRWMQAPEVVSVTDAKAPAAALSEIAQDAIRLLAAAERTPVRACEAPGCVLYFVKSHPRRAWCTDSCGNRVRAARHYARAREGHTGGGDSRDA